MTNTTNATRPTRHSKDLIDDKNLSMGEFFLIGLINLGLFGTGCAILVIFGNLQLP